MNIPTLPTDNLYKFVALAGAALVITGILSMTSLREDLDQQAYDLVKMRYDPSMELKELQLYPVPSTDADMKSSAAGTKAISEHNAQVMNHNQEILGRFARVSLDYERQRAAFGRRSVLNILAILLGITMMAWGFIMWYQRLQKYQDTLVRIQATEPQKTIQQEAQGGADNRAP